MMPGFYGAVSWERPLSPDIIHRLKRLAVPAGQPCLPNSSTDGLFMGFAPRPSAGKKGEGAEIPGYSVLFNGSLYNHKELLMLLPEEDRVPAAEDAAWLITRLFQKFNHHCFTRLNGDFSMALRDIHQRTFYLLNGKLHPRKIYYSQHKGCLFFSEDMETIIKISGLLPPLHLPVLPKYFAYGFVPSPNTLLEGVHRLASGTFLCFEQNITGLRAYWDIQFQEQEAPPRKQEAWHGQNVFQSLCQSTKRRLSAGSRVGLFLSGGLDSSSLAAVLKHISPETRVQTFTAVFDEKSFNEASRAGLVASFFQTRHHEILFTPQKALAFLKNWIEKVDDPFSDDDFICGGVLSPVAENLVDDVFLGDGPDELFMGYPSFLAHRITEIYARVPELFRKYFEAAIRFLPVSYRYCAFDARFKQFLGGVGYPPALRDAAWWGPFPPPYQNPLYPEDIRARLRLDGAEVYQEVLESQQHAHARTFVNQVLTAYIKILSERWLMKLNAVGQGTHLQFKMPYLDDDFIACVNSIPWPYKLKPKFILRQGMCPYLPQRIIRGKKRPFFVPLALWIKNDFKGLIRDILTAENIREAGLNHQAALQMCDEHFAGTTNNAKQIWNLLILIAWHRRIKRMGRGQNF